MDIDVSVSQLECALFTNRTPKMDFGFPLLTGEWVGTKSSCFAIVRAQKATEEVRWSIMFQGLGTTASWRKKKTAWRKTRRHVVSAIINLFNEHPDLHSGVTFHYSKCLWSIWEGQVSNTKPTILALGLWVSGKQYCQLRRWLESTSHRWDLPGEQTRQINGTHPVQERPTLD